VRLREEAETLAAQLKALEVTIKAKAGNEGKIFGSVTAPQVLEALEKRNVKLAKHQLVLESPIKELGTYQIAIKLTSEVHTSLTLHIEAE